MPFAPLIAVSMLWYIKYNIRGIINALKYSLKFHPPRDEQYEENGLSFTIFDARYNDGINIIMIKSAESTDIAGFNPPFNPPKTYITKSLPPIR